MSDLSDKLRTAREKKRLSISEAAFETRIRGAIIESLEGGDFTGLPPRPFLRGLLKNYAAFLGLDPELIYDEYEVAAGLKPAPPPAFEPLPPPIGAQEELTPSPMLRTTRVPASISAPSFSTSINLPFQDVTPSRTQPPPETIFQVGTPPNLEAPTVPPDVPTLSQRFARTRLPEIIAALAVVVAILGLFGFAYLRFFPANSSAGSQARSAESQLTVTSTPSSVGTKLPTPIPTFDATSPGTVNNTSANNLAIAVTSTPFGPTATLSIPSDAIMTLEVSANAPLDVWIIVDNVEVLKGTIQNDSRSWTAHERIFIQVKNIVNGQVLLNGRRILPAVFAERTLIQRAWLLNSAGKAISVPPEPFAAPTATPTPTFTNTPTATSTNTPTPTRTLTPTKTPTNTVTPTSTKTPTPTPTNTRTPTPCPSQAGVQC
jgi:cytoskeletal protein RodZ